MPSGEMINYATSHREIVRPMIMLKLLFQIKDISFLKEELRLVYNLGLRRLRR
jgi:hypothetical protein